jgi:hypothetical protein
LANRHARLSAAWPTARQTGQRPLVVLESTGQLDHDDCNALDEILLDDERLSMA